MIFFNILAWIATAFGIIMYAPQVFKTIKTKDTKELSKITFTIVAFATAFWTIYSIDVRYYQGWVMNIIILFLMIPILYLMYSKYFFIFITTCLLSLLLTSILILSLNVFLNLTLQYIFVILASIGISVSFYFQIFKTFKYKNASSLSILSLVVVFITNLLWTIYWLGRVILENGQSTLIIAFIASVLAAFSQLPLIYAFFKFKDNLKEKNYFE